MRALGLAVLGITLGFTLSGCGTVQPWERDILARSDMAFDPDPLEAALRSHIHFSKEAALRGGGAGGGGCGCN